MFWRFFWHVGVRDCEWYAGTLAPALSPAGSGAFLSPKEGKWFVVLHILVDKVSFGCALTTKKSPTQPQS